MLFYDDLASVTTVERTLKPHAELLLHLKMPTLLQLNSGYQKLLIFPGDQVMLSVDSTYRLHCNTRQMEQRNREFICSSVFQENEPNFRPIYPSRTTEYPLDSILSFEAQVKSGLPNYSTETRHLFDSLANKYKVSDRFKQSYKILSETNKQMVLFGLYQTYQTELKSNQLYLQKQKGFLPFVNGISDKTAISLGGYYFIESIAEDLMGNRIHFLKTRQELTNAMDSVVAYFHGLPRDYLLTRLMYSATKNGLLIPKALIRKYYAGCKDQTYKTVGKKLMREKRQYRVSARRKVNNRLISLATSKIFTMDEVIKQQIGKTLLLDFWASWCGSCLEAMPDVKKIEEIFSGEKFKVIYLSFDKEWLKWRIKSADLGHLSADTYLLENFDRQPFLTMHNVQEIPRYMLIDSHGRMVSAAAPSPADPALIALIKKTIATE